MKNTLPKKFWIVIYSEEHSKLVQSKLFELGKAWYGYGAKHKSNMDYPYGRFCISNNNSDGTKLGYGTNDFYVENSHDYGNQITTDFLLSCEIDKNISVVLNGNYTAIVSKNGVKVGCQEFPLDIIQKLVDAQKQL